MKTTEGTSSTADVVRRRLSVDMPGAIRLGPARALGPLTLVPIFGEAGATRLVPFAVAYEQSSVRVREVDSEGEVATVLVENSGAVPVLVMEGEILIGLKQNRVVTVSAVVPVAAEVAIPVSCVEAGRWHFDATAGGSDAYHLSPLVRGIRNRSVVASARTQQRYVADQVAVWEGVSERLAAHGVESPSQAYSDIGDRRGHEILDLAAEVRPEPEQVGVVAVFAGAVRCVELFDRPDTLAAVWSALVGSYVSDAMVAGDRAVPVGAEEAGAWVAELAAGETTVHPGVGDGETVVVTTPSATATGVVVDGALVHLAALAR